MHGAYYLVEIQYVFIGEWTNSYVGHSKFE